MLLTDNLIKEPEVLFFLPLSLSVFVSSSFSLFLSTAMNYPLASEIIGDKIEDLKQKDLSPKHVPVINSIVIVYRFHN